MNDLRTAAQQALEALLNCPSDITDEMFESIRSLKAALAQQDERDWSLLEATQDSLREHMAEIHRLRAALAQQAEPVAWFDERRGSPTLLPGAPLLEAGQLLYTAPPQRKPLTEEEIDRIPCTDGDGSDWDALVRFARAVEAAHGIKEEA